MTGPLLLASPPLLNPRSSHPSVEASSPLLTPASLSVFLFHFITYPWCLAPCFDAGCWQPWVRERKGKGCWQGYVRLMGDHQHGAPQGMLLSISRSLFSSFSIRAGVFPSLAESTWKWGLQMHLGDRGAKTKILIKQFSTERHTSVKPRAPSSSERGG